MVPWRKDYLREDQLLGVTLPRHVRLHVSKPARTLENVWPKATMVSDVMSSIF